MAQFKKRVFGENVSKEVIEEFKKLSGGGLDGTSLQPLETRNPSFQKYLGERSPFSRMWCAVNINTLSEIPPDGQKIEKNSKGEYFYFIDPNDESKGTSSILGSDATSETRVFVVNENNEKSYGTNNPLESVQTDGLKSLQQVKQLQNNPLMKPSAGITSVTSKTQGALGALQNTTVEFVVHNKHDFENIFLPFFLKPGSIVCIDYGWSDASFSLYNPIDQIKNRPLDMSEFDEYLYGEKGFINQNIGKINTVMGNVTSYEANVTTEGSYNCSMEIVSRNTSLLDKKVTDNNGLKFIFSNVINDILIEVLATAAGADALSLEQLTEQFGSIEEGDAIEAKKAFFTSLNVIDEGGYTDKTTGIITPTSSKTGIFHQDMSYFVKDERSGLHLSQKLGNQEELTYISYGLFEDLFLNNFVAGTIPTEQTEDDKGFKKSVKFTKDPSKDYSNRFDSRTTYIRWDSDLAEIARQKIEPNEALPTFVIPDNWDESYNSKTLGGEIISTQDCIEGNHPDYIGISVMPLRDLFIKVPLISNAFKTKDSINEALISILDDLNFESHKVWNLKISGNMDSKASVKITDTNLMPEIKDEKEMLIFDVTGPTSIASTCDLKFTTPKAGLSSMIAIGNLNGPQRFEDLELSALNNLNLLNKPTNDKNQPTIVKSLPLQGVPNPQITKPATAIDFSNFVKENNVTMDDSTAATVKERYSSYLVKLKREEEDAVKDAKAEDKKNQFVKHEGNFTLVNSARDFYKERLRTKYYDQSQTDRIAPILPVELDLTIYGNRYLQIGDYFTINYLPKHYRDNVFFQIIGTEDRVDVNTWATSYTAIMRVKPNKKELITGKPKLKEVLINGKIKPPKNKPTDLVARTWSSYDDEFQKVRDSYDAGYKIFPIKSVKHELEFSVFERKINPSKYWAKIEERPGDPLVENMAYYFTSAGKGVNVGNIKDLAFSCALRDVLLSKSLTPFREDSFIQSTYRKLPGGRVNDLIEKINDNASKIIFLEVKSQSGVLNIFDLSDKQEGAIAKVLSNVEMGDYLFKESFFETTEVESYWIKDDVSYTLAKFIESYQFGINTTDYENEYQSLYQIDVTGVGVFTEIYLPFHLLKKPQEGELSVSDIGNFLQNLRERFDAYYTPLKQYEQDKKGFVPKITTNFGTYGG